MALPDGLIHVQVCFAKPQTCVLEELVLPAGATVLDAIQKSGIVTRCPEVDLSVSRVGVYGKLKSLDTVLRDRDRVEIYRPLVADPKDSRRKRAGKNAR
jgi:uncharacterized protein